MIFLGTGSAATDRSIPCSVIAENSLTVEAAPSL